MLGNMSQYCKMTCQLLMIVKKLILLIHMLKYGDHVEAKIILRNKAAEMGANFIMLEKVYVTIDSEG